MGTYRRRAGRDDRTLVTLGFWARSAGPLRETKRLPAAEASAPVSQLIRRRWTVRKTGRRCGCDLVESYPGMAPIAFADMADRAHGFLVDVGGEVRTRGRNEGARVAVAIGSMPGRRDISLVPDLGYGDHHRRAIRSIVKSTASGSRTFSIRGLAVR